MATIFAIDKNIDLATLLAGLPITAKWQANAPETIDSTYYDTFDWRLHNESTYLVLIKSPHSHVLKWCNKDSSQRIEWVNTDKAPDFSWNLPNSSLKNALEPILKERRLLPYILLKQRMQSFTLLNSDEKIILRVLRESPRAVHAQTGKSKSLSPRLHIQALKGYPKPYKELVKYLRSHFNLELANDSLLDAIAAHNIKPGDYCSKLSIKLDPEMRSDASVKQFLAELLDTMERNEAGIEADLDSEFLHDFRVAGRRSRSAIGQIKEIMPVRVLNRLQRDFSWLNQISGPCRDMDVYLLGFPAYQSILPEQQQSDLEPLREFLTDHKNKEYKRLVRALHSSRYQHFKDFLRNYLETPIKEHTTLTHAKQPITEVSAQRIWRVYRRVIKEGKAINKNSANEELHELRKSCKKLRYLLEFCRSLYPKKDMRYLINALKELQDNLGEFQDYSVQIEALKHFSQQMVEEKRANAKTLAAMNQLVEILHQEQLAIRNVFHKCFNHFSTKKVQSIFKRLFHPGKSIKNQAKTQVAE